MKNAKPKRLELLKESVKQLTVHQLSKTIGGEVNPPPTGRPSDGRAPTHPA